MSLFRKIAMAALAGALFAAPTVARAESTVSGQNHADAPESESGSAFGESTAEIQAGPQATGADSASSSQNGANTGQLRQESRTKSGDSVAGGQVTGSVGGDTTVQVQNDAIDALSTTGDAESTNDITGFLGPIADADVAQATQLGPNDIGLDQLLDNGTGDAVSGGQITGLVD